MATRGGDLVVSRSLRLPPHELTWRFSGSGGPGGQHANTANTRVELVFDIAGSSALGPRQRERLLERFGTSVRVVASNERSQLRNRALAAERLAAMLRDALALSTTRVATRPTPGSKERRLKEKRATAERKRRRRVTEE